MSIKYTHQPHNELGSLLSPIDTYSKGGGCMMFLEPLVEGSDSLLTPGCVVGLV